MRIPLTILLIGWGLTNSLGASPDPGQDYVEAWKRFYPSEALAQGLHASIFYFEDRSPEAIRKWVAFNQGILEQLGDSSSTFFAEQPIDARLLRIQARTEIDRWVREAPHQQSLSLYASLIAGAVDKVLGADFLTAPEKSRLACQRLESVQQLCTAARQSLKGGDRGELEQSLQALAEAANYYEKTLPEQALLPQCANFAERCRATAEDIRALYGFVESEILPNATSSDPILGREDYARRLSLYTDSPLTPERLADLALEEIEHAKKLMVTVAREYLQGQYPGRPLPEDAGQMVQWALADMEKEAPKNGAEYLQFWQQLAADATAFIEEKEIATLPQFQTLRILSAPESAGPAARIGWVESAPPFAPNPVTTLYLPSIPDTFPEQERTDFWASFNKPFNRMIVIHELFPGHYMQIKISRETPHPVRLLFPYGPYFEGWATFTERVCLDAGWEKGNYLTFLAHLRKRVENANRAYTSVQVHCNGWNQEQVMRFSAETSLLAPQFAKSLWGRIMRAPLQLTSYFLGGRQFSDLLAAERERQGKQFNLKDFMDTIMRAGPIPIDEFPKIFSNIAPE